MRRFILFCFIVLTGSVSANWEECMSCQWVGNWPYCFPDGSHWSEENTDCDIRVSPSSGIYICRERANLECGLGSSGGGTVPLTVN